MKASVDADLCAGCGVCVDVCPEVFEMNDEDVAVVLVEIVPEEHEEACQDAADQCPSEAIVIEE